MMDVKRCFAEVLRSMREFFSLSSFINLIVVDSKCFSVLLRDILHIDSKVETNVGREIR